MDCARRRRASWVRSAAKSQTRLSPTRMVIQFGQQEDTRFTDSLPIGHFTSLSRWSLSSSPASPCSKSEEEGSFPRYQPSTPLGKSESRFVPGPLNLQAVRACKVPAPAVNTGPAEPLANRQRLGEGEVCLSICRLAHPLSLFLSSLYLPSGDNPSSPSRVVTMTPVHCTPDQVTLLETPSGLPPV